MKAVSSGLKKKKKTCFPELKIKDTELEAGKGTEEWNRGNGK